MEIINDYNSTLNVVVQRTGELDAEIKNLSNKTKSLVKKDCSNLTENELYDFKNILSSNSFDVIYDKASNDANLNWGYTGGIGSTSLNRDFSGYKSLNFYVQANYVFGGAPWKVTAKIYFDFNNLVYDGNAYRHVGHDCFYNENNCNYSIYLKINEQRNQLQVGFVGYAGSSQGAGIVYKIEGVK